MVPRQRNCPQCDGSLRRFCNGEREYWCGCVVSRKTEKILRDCEKPFKRRTK